jgi:putative two-component system response regulator
VRDRVLLVDDEPNVLATLARMLRQRYEVSTAGGADEALEQLDNAGPFAVVISDHNMPGATGVALLLEVARRAPDTVRLMLTGQLDLDVAVRAVNEGNVFRFLTKPCPSDQVVAAVAAGVGQYHLVRSERDLRTNLEARVGEQVREIESSHLATIFALSKLAESRDPETGGRLHRLREYCRVLSEGLDTQLEHSQRPDSAFIGRLFAAAPLHDVGKVGIPDAILLKPGGLSHGERIVMQTHTLIGADTLLEVDTQHPGNALVQMGVEIARSHHERWDGAGYPEGLAGERIPLSAQVVAVADVYDAVRSRRCYKGPRPHSDARDAVLAGRGTQFSPAVVDAFAAAEEALLAVAEVYGDA